MGTRLKGQEAVLSFTDPDGDVDNLGDLKSFNAELDMEILQEGYLGETADQYDDIYHGVGGDCELHMPNTTWFRFSEKVTDRAERRTAAAGKFSVTSSFQFPSGERPRLTFEDIFFGPLPINVGSRTEYVTVKLTWKGQRLRRVL